VRLDPLCLRATAVSIEFRTPTEDDRERMLDVLQAAFGMQPAWRERMGPHLRLELYVCAYEGDRLTATSLAHPLQQYFGGREVACAGIGAVAGMPDVRGKGTGGALVAELIRRRREAGDLFSTLYPATVAVYRKLGYEVAGAFTELSAPLRALPRTGGEGIELETLRDDSRLDDMRACFRRWAPGHNGPVWFEDDFWWRARILRLTEPDAVPHVVLAHGDDGLQGYACYQRGPREGFGIDPSCTHLIARTRRAAAALFGYFGGYHSVGDKLSWHGPPHEPLSLLLAESRSVKRSFEFPWMSRLLDVPGALEARGYPDVDGECVISVDDPLFPENAGPFRIEADAGKVAVSRVEGPAGRPIPVGLLSSLFTGHLSPADLVRLGGAAPDDPALPVLGRLFSGSPPWSPDFF
jgi:predicted acetyltransferase